MRFDDIVLVSQATQWEDLFIAKADARGHIQWAMRGGGGVHARGYGVLCDKSGNVFLSAGILRTAARFDGITLNPRPVDDGYETVVLAKISPTPPLAIRPSAQGVQDYLKKHGTWKGKSNPQPGDALTFDWSGRKGWADHVGMVERVYQRGGTVLIDTIEGNSSDGVRRRTYRADDPVIKGFGSIV